MNRRHRLLEAAAVLVGYTALALLLYGKLHDPRTWYVGAGNDPLTFMWCIRWWPYALAHGLNPFVTRYAWFPGGDNLAWATSVPSAALMALPFTLLGSAAPLAFNVLTISAPALAACTAYLLLRELTPDRAACAIGGFLFGFSAYETGQMLGHLNLDMIALLPLGLWLCLRRLRRGLARRRFIVSLALVFAAQLGLSSEILASACLFGALTLLLFWLRATVEERPRLVSLARDILLSGALALLLTAPMLVYLALGATHVPNVGFLPEKFSTDLLNVVVPTTLMRVGGAWLAPVSSRFKGGLSEQGGYLGLPLLLIVAFYAYAFRKNRAAQALLAMAGIVLLASLGPKLHIDRLGSHLRLPWYVFTRLPITRVFLPSRFSLYVSLAATVMAAAWIADSGWPSRRFKLAVGLAACLALVPARSAFLWARYPALGFFTPAKLRVELPPHANVLILPFGAGGDGMAWQLQSAMGFTQSGGYLGFIPPQEAPWSKLLESLRVARPGPDFPQTFLAYCIAHRVDYVLVVAATPAALASAANGLHWPTTQYDDVTVLNVPARSPPQPSAG